VLWKCDDCTTLYAPDLPRCPHCGATGHTEVDSGGQPVAPKFPAHDGPTPEPAAKAEPPVKAEAPAKAKPAGGRPAADA
jgi:hypothetical protein